MSHFTSDLEMRRNFLEVISILSKNVAFVELSSDRTAIPGIAILSGLGQGFQKKLFPNTSLISQII